MPAKKSSKKKKTTTKSNVKGKNVIKPGSKSNKDVEELQLGIKWDEIKSLAENFSNNNLGYDDSVWLLAEKELSVSKALKDVKQEGVESNSITKFVVNPTKVVKNPSKAKVQQLAEKIFQQGHSIQELHWLLAEKNILLDRVLK